MTFELENYNNNDCYFNQQALYLNENKEIPYYEDNGCQPELNVALNEDNVKKNQIKEIERISTKYTFPQNKSDLDNLKKRRLQKKIGKENQII